MRTKNMSTYYLASAAMLIAVSVLFQMVHIGWQTPYGIWIDLVAIPWILALFIFGFEAAAVTAVLSSAIIAIIAPSGFVGALLKFVATFPMILVPWLFIRMSRMDSGELKKPEVFMTTLALALIGRGLLVLPFNYYFAIPVYFGMSTEQALAFMPPAALFILNAIQGTLEFTVAWILAYKYKLSRFR